MRGRKKKIKLAFTGEVNQDDILDRQPRQH